LENNQAIDHPRSNPWLFGHCASEQTFLNSWQSGRIHHAWLLTGPRGIGKATFAFRIARFVLSCTNAQPSLGSLENSLSSLALKKENPIFKRVASGGHSDLMILERTFNNETNSRKTSISVEEARAAGDFLHLTASDGGWRVLIIDSADELNLNAANALLKIVEEPPDNALMILTCHAQGSLLPTLRSRCNRIQMDRLKFEDLKNVFEQLSPDIDEDDLKALSYLSDGSPGRALTLAKGDGLNLYKELICLIRQLPNIETPLLHKFGDRISRRGAEDSFRLAVELLVWWVSRLTLMSAKGEPIPNVVAEENDCANRFATETKVDRWVEVWEKVSRLAGQTDRLNLDRKQVIINMFQVLKGAVKG